MAHTPIGTGVLPWVVALTLVGCIADVASAQGLQRITAAGQRQMLDKPGTATAGAVTADLYIVEYFDYNCPYCKKLVPTFQSLLAQDRKLAVVYKDWPIFGGISVYAAKSAVAAQWQGKYLAAHEALMSGPRLVREDQVDAILQRAGVNVETLKSDRITHAADIDTLLSRNNEEARALGLKGTPGIVVGRELLPGAASLSDLQQIVEQARHEH